ncbi:hypothetical protein VNO77_04939 [Canavalia gladiata]|uniref:Malectin-like domain-containing protein n=1 Tax=Canavalia gladiata TaxID=3824 RepID=A0AAN9MZG0_CANGL
MGTHQGNKLASHTAKDSISGDSLSFAGLVSIEDQKPEVPDPNQDEDPDFEFSTILNSGANAFKITPADVLISNGQIKPHAIAFQPNSSFTTYPPISLRSLLAIDHMSSSSRKYHEQLVKARNHRSKETSFTTTWFGRKVFRSVLSPCRKCKAIQPGSAKGQTSIPEERRVYNIDTGDELALRVDLHRGIETAWDMIRLGSTDATACSLLSLALASEVKRRRFSKRGLQKKKKLWRERERERSKGKLTAMLLRFLQLWMLCFACVSCAARQEPFAMRLSCGASQNVETRPTSTLWYKDFGYTGGIASNATRPSNITPPLKTLRYFPLSEGPQNCYSISKVPKGHYSVRIFFGLVDRSRDTGDPVFDISIEGTQIYSLKPGWTKLDDQVFAEALVFLTNGSVSICFHSTGHGDPAILSIEILQIGDKAYYFSPVWSQRTILRTVKRLSCGFGQSKFDVDYDGDPRGGDRFWQRIKAFGEDSDQPRSVETRIKHASQPPNFYPETLYQSALVSSNSQPDLTYTLEVDPNRNYSIWLHFAEIDNSVTAVGQRVFDIMINGDLAFKDIDIVKLSGDLYTALVLNKTVTVNGRTLTITLSPKERNLAIISAIEIFEVIMAESKTLPEEVWALQTLKKALGLPPRFGWNGDPCVPQQHPWSGVDCQIDRSSGSWVIDGLGLDNQGLKGFLPNDVSRLLNLQILNLSGNSIHGAIPSSIGAITSLQELDLSYNVFNGSIPESLGQLTSLQRLNLNGNILSGRVPATLVGRLLYRASFNFTDNAGLCGIPGLPTCGLHLSAGAKITIGLGASFAFLLLVTFSVCWWKRRQNILRTQKIAARAAPYAKARTHFSRDILMTRHHNNGNTCTAAENGPILLS